MIQKTEGPGVRRVVLLLAAFGLGAGSWAGWTAYRDRGLVTVTIARSSPYFYNTLAAASGEVCLPAGYTLDPPASGPDWFARNAPVASGAPDRLPANFDFSTPPPAKKSEDKWAQYEERPKGDVFDQIHQQRQIDELLRRVAELEKAPWHPVEQAK